MDADRVRVHFTDPAGGFEQGEELVEAITRLIGMARYDIALHSLSLNLDDEFVLHEAILAALKREVKLYIYGHDRRQVQRLAGLYSAFEPESYCWTGAKPGLYHIKAICVDGQHVYLGSANFSKNAMTRSAEWGCILRSTDIVKRLSEYASHLVEAGYLGRI